MPFSMGNLNLQRCKKQSVNYIKIFNSDTILSLKEKIYRRENIKVAHQRMVYAGKNLENKKTLYDYNINKESTIVLLPRFSRIDKKTDYLMNMRRLLNQTKLNILRHPMERSQKI